VLQGAIKFANNYAEEAQKLAANEKNPERKKELLEIAEVCKRVPLEPPRISGKQYNHFGLPIF